MTRVLVVGARGMLGSTLCPRLEALGHTVLRQSRNRGFNLQFDPCSIEEWSSVLRRERPEVIINLVAATDVDRCEGDPQWAYEANVAPVMAFVQAASRNSELPHLVHISTDQVYDGIGPHSEEEARPCNVYALSKLAAELAIKQHPSTVLRTNFFGASRSPSRQSFSDWIIRSLKAKQHITVFKDVLFNAMHINSLTDVIDYAVRTQPQGLYNAGTDDGISKADFALILAKTLRISTSTLRLGSVSDLKLRARRPLDMRMDTARFRRSFEIQVPLMNDQIELTANEYRD